jgi:hypothetical protein
LPGKISLYVLVEIFGDGSEGEEGGWVEKSGDVVEGLGWNLK